MFKSMKKFLLSLLIVATALSSAMAQEREGGNLRWRGFATNRFWDNWEISAAGGNSLLQISKKMKDDHGKFIDRNGWNANVAVTKWVVPIIGMRLQVDAGEFRNYAFDKKSYGTSAFETPYIYVHGDVLMNMSNWIGGYRPNRVYSAISYLGFGYTAMSWTDKSAGSYNGEFAFTTGLLNKFRVSRQMDIELDLRSWIFPGHQLPKQIRSQNRIAVAMSASLGIAYRFRTREWTPAYTQYDVDGYIAAIVALEEDILLMDGTIASAGKQIEKLTADNNRLSSELEACKKSKGAVKEAVTIPDGVVFFAIGEATLTDYARASLDKYISVVKGSNAMVHVTGYADKETGSSARNMELSKERAEAVKNYLVAGGIAANHITAKWVGDTEVAFASPETPIVNRCVILQ